MLQNSRKYNFQLYISLIFNHINEKIILKLKQNYK